MMTAADIEELGYAWPRQLPDGRWVAIMPMLYTWGLFVNIDPVGYSYRYCFEHAHDAVESLRTWNGEGDAPGPWIKRKGLGRDLLNPNWLAEAKADLA